MNVPHRITATGVSNETTAYERSDTLPFVHAPFVVYLVRALLQ
jgi:hypothetical protein